MTTYFLDQFDHLPADKRLATFLKQELANDYNARATSLASACGYSRQQVVDMWVSERTAVPIKVIPKMAAFLGHDIAHVLPLWISAYAGGEEQDVLWQAAKRMLTTWEMGLIHTARDIYVGDADD